jgi:hypothetical protein
MVGPGKGADALVSHLCCHWDFFGIHFELFFSFYLRVQLWWWDVLYFACESGNQRAFFLFVGFRAARLSHWWLSPEHHWSIADPIL